MKLPMQNAPKLNCLRFYSCCYLKRDTELKLNETKGGGWRVKGGGGVCSDRVSGKCWRCYGVQDQCSVEHIEGCLGQVVLHLVTKVAVVEV